MFREEHIRTILDSIADGLFTVNEEFRITWFNQAAEAITGIKKEDALDRRCSDVLGADICSSACALRHSVRTGQPIVNKPVTIRASDGRKMPISISTALLQNERGETVGGVETFRDLTLVEELRRELHNQFRIGDIVSRSPRMRQIADTLPQIAESDATCVIEGESGTGKELIARAIHDLSLRKDGPFVGVNCGALPDTLLESELFGYEPGAFTDAKSSKDGRFALAEGGTIFLDEIGDMSPALQVRLLRILQEKCYERLGGTETLHTNVRVIAATNADLLSMVREKTFRHDLYYRINVVRISLPPLRERLEDIPLLVDRFVSRFNRLKRKEIVGISQGVLELLMQYTWVGNVRELENAIEHAFILCPGGLIERRHLPEQFGHSCHRAASERYTLEDMEACHILNVLESLEWNRQETASRLGIDKSTLWRKIKKYHLDNSGSTVGTR